MPETNGGGRVELRDLDAREVSLVDSPAIGERFVVIKRNKGGHEMADEKKKDEEKQDEETQAKKDEEKQDEETQAKKDEEKQEEQKGEETNQASAAMVGALKQVMSLVNRLMKLAGVKGYGEPMQKNEDGDEVSIESLMAQGEFLMEELSAGRVPDAEAVEKAGKRVTPSRLKRLEAFSQELQNFISDLKGEEKKEETQDDKGKDKTEKKTDGDKKDDDPLVAALDKINKRLDAIEAASGVSRGESTDEAGGGKEKTEKADEGSMNGFFVGIGGIN